MFFQNCDCKYCKTHNYFHFITKLSNGNPLDDLYWIEIPKNGSASIKTKYNISLHNEFTLPIFDIKKYKDEKTLVVLRDPIVRFISLFNHYFLLEGNRFDIGSFFFKSLGHNNINKLSVDERVEFLINNLDKLSTREEVHHFYPQSHFIPDTFTNIELVDISDLSRRLGVGKRHHTETKTEVKLTDKQLKYLKDLYKDDYIFFDKYGFTPKKKYEKSDE